MISNDVLKIKLDKGNVSSIRTRNSTGENKLVFIVLPIKNFVESCFVIYCSGYASGIRNLYWQGDLCLRKLPALGSLVHVSKILKSLFKKICARASGTLNFESYWLKSISFIN